MSLKHTFSGCGPDLHFVLPRMLPVFPGCQNAISHVGIHLQSSSHGLAPAGGTYAPDRCQLWNWYALVESNHILPGYKPCSLPNELSAYVWGVMRLSPRPVANIPAIDQPCGAGLFPTVSPMSCAHHHGAM